MIQQPLWQVSVATATQAEDAVAALLEQVFGEAAVVYTEAQQPVSTVTVYTTQHTRNLEHKREALEQGLSLLRACKLNLGPGDVLIRRVAREDWTHSWKKYFKVIEIGSALLIRPSWSKRRARPGQAVVILDPGLSFGTGQHPTTAFCLKQIVAARTRGQAQSFLDIGTGSGILAIAAAKLKFSPVRAFDNDPAAVRVARANARRNRVEDKIEIRRWDLNRLSINARVRDDLVCANLVAELLTTEARRIASRVASGGKLVLAGVLTSQFAEVQRCYEALGFNIAAINEEGGWKSGSFQRSE
jgi:ribosomal protein L11 methyltransferase